MIEGSSEGGAGMRLHLSWCQRAEAFVEVPVAGLLEDIPDLLVDQIQSPSARLGVFDASLFQ
jgi:hypothetical protein